MTFVVDASVTAAWYLPDEASPYADRVLIRLADEEAIAPAIWPAEVTNTLLVGVRRQRITEEDFITALERLGALPIVLDNEPSNEEALNIGLLAHAQGLTAYEASYLYIARRESLPLASQDRRLREAATRSGVRLLE